MCVEGPWKCLVSGVRSPIDGVSFSISGETGVAILQFSRLDTAWDPFQSCATL